MSKESFLDYLTKKELLSALTTPSEKVKKSSLEDVKKSVLKEMKAKKISAAKIRKLWTLSLNNLFSSEYQRAYQFTPTKKYDTSTKLKNMLQKNVDEIIKDSKYDSITSYVAKINSNPLHYTFNFTFEKVKDFTAYLNLSVSKHVKISIFPEIGFCTVFPSEKDDKQKIISKILSSAFPKLNEIKVNALLLRKYSTQETINKLVISTPQEIAGFSGLDVIEFKGPNVVIGLSGLKRRHDANVDVITRVGPFTEIESETISLICGKGMKIKNYDGMETLLKVLKS